MLGSKVLLLIPCLCFGVIVLKWKQSGEPSIASLEMQLSNLQRQLQGFDKLKEDYVREEIELGWDRQHLTELKDRRAELSNSLAQMSDAFKEGQEISETTIAKWLELLQQCMRTTSK